MSEPPQSWGQPPPPQQPAWQPPVAPAYGPPRTSRSNRLPWILGGAGLLLVLGVGVLLLVLNSGGDTSGARAAASSFVAAVTDGDCEAVTSLTSDHFQQTYGGCTGDVEVGGILGSSGVTLDNDVSISDETDDTATAEVQVSAAGFSLPVQLLMVREGERWLVDDLSVAGFGLDDAPSFGPPG